MEALGSYHNGKDKAVEGEVLLTKYKLVLKRGARKRLHQTAATTAAAATVAAAA